MFCPPKPSAFETVCFSPQNTPLDSDPKILSITIDFATGCSAAI
jgi:hypothetical protein